MEFALVGGDLLVEARLGGVGGLGGSGMRRSIARKPLALKSFGVYSLASNFSFEVFRTSQLCVVAAHDLR